jgi:cystathionine gamma-synthase
MRKTGKLSQGTLSVWAGETRGAAGEGTQVPVVSSVAFGYGDVEEWQAVGRGEASGHIYSRNSNPTVSSFEEKVKELEAAEASTSFATGMAAISNTLFTLLSPGDRVVSIRDSYGGTSKLFSEFLPRFGIDVTLCDTTSQVEVEEAVETGCTLLYLESPTNPTLKLVDIAGLASAAHTVNATVVVDNTFATPINQNPLQLGADLVIHSATKYLGGHADALGGVVCGDTRLVRSILHFREITGASLDPVAAYQLLRGMKTLHLRIERQCLNARRIAQYLENHNKVTMVYYPGLESHPQHALARKQMRGFGGMLSFELAGEPNSVARFLEKLQLAHRAANLGSVETIVGIPSTTSHVECSLEERQRLGIPENLIRYSAGVEDAEDLIADLERALASL